MPTRLTLAALALIASTTMGWIGCTSTPANDVVTIRYQQLGACNGFNNGSGVTSVGPNHAYVAFKLSTVENKDSAARDFTFEPNRLYIDQTPRVFTDTKLLLAQLNPFSAISRFVAKGTTETLNGSVFAVVSTVATEGASEANKTSYFLLYDSPAGGQGILLNKANPSQTTWPNTPDCLNIVF